MARYIDVNRLIADGWMLERHGISNKLLQVMSIADVPTADVVPVVRCCNCIHLKTNTSKKNYCDIHSTTWDKFYVRLDDYCSYGERK